MPITPITTPGSRRKGSIVDGIDLRPSAPARLAWKQQMDAIIRSEQEVDTVLAISPTR